MNQLVTVSFGNDDVVAHGPMGDMYASAEAQLNDFWATYEIDADQVVSITPTHAVNEREGWEEFRITVTVAVSKATAERIRAAQPARRK